MDILGMLIFPSRVPLLVGFCTHYCCAMATRANTPVFCSTRFMDRLLSMLVPVGLPLLVRFRVQFCRSRVRGSITRESCSGPRDNGTFSAEASCLSVTAGEPFWYRRRTPRALLPGRSPGASLGHPKRADISLESHKFGATVSSCCSPQRSNGVFYGF